MKENIEVSFSSVPPSWFGFVYHYIYLIPNRYSVINTKQVKAICEKERPGGIISRFLKVHGGSGGTHKLFFSMDGSGISHLI